MTHLTAALNRFVDRLRARLAAGAGSHDDTAFTRPAADLANEVMQELEDVAGWALLLWIRLDPLRGRVEQLHEQGGNDG